MENELTFAQVLGVGMSVRLHGMGGRSSVRGRGGFVLILAMVVVSVTFAACGGGDPADDQSGDTSLGDPASAVGPGISVADALGRSIDEPLLVNGMLIATTELVQLCEVLMESFPPQCGGLRLVVQNLDLGTIAGLQTATRESQPVTWSNQPIQLLGRVSDGVLTVSDTVQ